MFPWILNMHLGNMGESFSAPDTFSTTWRNWPQQRKPLIVNYDAAQAIHASSNKSMFLLNDNLKLWPIITSPYIF